MNFLADVWSVGCILAELSLGRPLFPGEDCKFSYYRIFTIGYYVIQNSVIGTKRNLITSCWISLVYRFHVFFFFFCKFVICRFRLCGVNELFLSHGAVPTYSRIVWKPGS